MSFTAGLKSLGKDVSRGLDDMAKTVSKEVNQLKSTALLDMFRTGNVIQLISRSSGRCIQIVTAPSGLLVLDGNGPEGNQFLHAHWTIYNHGKNIVSFQNQANFLAIQDGHTLVLPFPSPQQTTNSARFQLIEVANFVALESRAEHGRHVGIQASGALKSAVATGTEIDGQFGVRLIFSPYAAPPRH